MANTDEDIVQEIIELISDWESEMNDFFGQWNEHASAFRMIDNSKDRRPTGVSRSITAETPRATDALATSMTRMQTAADPFYELRSRGASEEILYDMETRYQRQLTDFEFKRNLLKGNRGLSLFGTQIWEEPYITRGFGVKGTDFRPLSLLQVAFEKGCYDIRQSCFISPIYRVSDHYLRSLVNSGDGVWDNAMIERAMKEKAAGSGQSGMASSSIEKRRIDAKYQDDSSKRHELILFSGKLNQAGENSVIAKMWQEYGREDDPRDVDITFGILNRKYIVRRHPTPYGTWHHMYKVGHYIEFELESIGYGVGRLGINLQKDMNRTQRYMMDVAKFSLWNMFMAGRGAGLRSNNLQVYPWSIIPVDDVKQVLPLSPQSEGIAHGLKLQEMTREDFRAVTHATSTLQAVITGATATESSLAQSEALRAVSLTAEINADSVIRPHLMTMHRNEVDQNPYDDKLIPDVDFVCKLTTDKDYKPEYSKQLLQFLQITTSIKSQMPLEFNPMPLIKYFARALGINPRDLKEPRSQIDLMTDIMRRVNGGGSPAKSDNETAGEVAGAGAPQEAPDPSATVPSPISGQPGGY